MVKGPNPQSGKESEAMERDSRRSEWKTERHNTQDTGRSIVLFILAENHHERCMDLVVWIEGDLQEENSM